MLSFTPIDQSPALRRCAMPLAWIPQSWQTYAPTAWVLLWVILATATVALVVMFRTRWRHVKSWKRCAVLSLWVHLLLACLAMTVRVVSGSAGLGAEDQPMRVSVVMESHPRPLLDQPTAEQPTAEQLQDEPAQVEETNPAANLDEAPAWEEAQDPPVVAPLEQPSAETPGQQPDEPTPADEAVAELAPQESPEVAEIPAAPLEAPDLLASRPVETLQAESPQIETKPVETESVEIEPATTTPAPTKSEAIPALETPAEQVVEPAVEHDVEPSFERRPDDAQSMPSQPTENEAIQEAALPIAQRTESVPQAYAQRFAENREQLLQRNGGNAATERAVRSALAWLAGAQSRDGRWDASRHGGGHEQTVLGHNRQGAGGNADTGVSGLSLLAFLGSGHTHESGLYATQVEQGLGWLASQQASDGSLAGDAQFFARTYCHSMASFALNEALAITDDSQLRPTADAAVRYSLSLQNAYDGGWRYRRGQAGDTSQLGWQLMSLKSAELAGIDIPETTWSGIERFLRRVRRGQQGGLAAYTTSSRPSRTMTAEAYFCRQLIAARYRGNVGEAAAAEARTSLLRTLPGGGKQNLYYWYYATLALHHGRLHAGEGEQTPAAQAWNRWNTALVAELLTSQREDGSWASSTVWGGYGGRVYTTAMAALCLEVYYRYAASEESQIAERRRDAGYGYR